MPLEKNPKMVGFLWEGVGTRDRRTGEGVFEKIKSGFVISLLESWQIAEGVN